MTVEYRLIQYCDDPARAEYRNFAVVGRDQKYCQVRCVLPLDERKVDSGALLPWLTVSSDADLWVFEEWRQWLRRFSENLSRDPLTAWRELDGITRKGEKWRTSEGGVVETSERESLSEVMYWLEDRVLGDAHWFGSELKRAIQISELQFHKARVDSLVRIGEETVFLNLFLDKRSGLAVRGLQLRYRDDPSLAREVNDLIFTGHVVRRRVRNRVLFVDDFPRLRKSIGRDLPRFWQVFPMYEGQPHILLRQLSGL